MPIGLPVTGSSALVLSPTGSLVPPGCVGELYSGGDGLALGYHNQPYKTSQVFVINAYGEGRLYRTGDLVWLDEDGQLMFAGRADTQVKVRGFRIEPGEIMHQIDSIEGVASSLVQVTGETAADKQLVAWVVVDKQHPPTREGLRSELAAKVPEHMVPAFFLLLEDWPLTAVGKIDRRALPMPDALSQQEEYVAPRDATEQQLVVLWAELLSVEADELSVTANFFRIGGHSLLATRLMTRMRETFGVEISVRVVFEHPTISELAAVLNQTDASVRPPLVARERGGEIPLSFAQQRLWFIDQLQGASRLYNMPFATRIVGPLEGELVKAALTAIFRRHEVLRSTYHAQSADPIQQVHDEMPLPFISEDLRGMDDVEAHIARAVTEEATGTFDLSQDAMLRGRLLRSGDDEHILLLTMHHIASDGVSMDVLMSEFGQLMAGLSRGTAVTDILPPLDIQYADYALWQRSWLRDEVLARQVDYWKRQLEDLPQVHSLALDRARPASMDHTGDDVSLWLDAKCLKGLRAVAQQHEVTLFMLLHSAFALLLSRHSFERDIVIGTPVANRTHHALEGLIGFFVNTLVLRLDVDPQASLAAYLKNVRQVHLEAQEHQDIPFELLVEQLNPERSQQHTPLFQVMMNYLQVNEQAQSGAKQSGLSFEPLVAEDSVAQFELTLTAIEYVNGPDSRLKLGLNYATALFDGETILAMLQRLQILLSAISNDSVANIAALRLLREEELSAVALPEVEPGVSETLVQHRFQQQAERHGNRVALIQADQQWTYAQVNIQANRLAHYLRSEGVTVNTPVAIYAEKSARTIVAILAILKAGGAYVPLDPAYPSERLNFMLQDSGCQHLICHSEAYQKLDTGSVDCLCELHSEDFAQRLQTQPDTNLSFSQDDSALAYLIYTSGSTGKPKGVKVQHGNWLAYGDAAIALYQCGYEDRILQFSSMSFDIFVEELTLSLLNGATLVMPDNDLVLSGPDFWSLVNRQKVSICSLPTAFWHALCADDLPQPADIPVIIEDA
jgi:non-ribosomal peptide synthetase component F/acyl carrier protein